jgi:hypothetical protein
MNYWVPNPFFGFPPINVNNIQIVTTAAGSPSTNSTFNMTFTSIDPADYQTRNPHHGDPNIGIIASWLELSSFGTNTRRPAGQNSNKGCFSRAIISV